MFLVRVIAVGILTVLHLGCYASDLGGEDGFDSMESRTRTHVAPGFDSPHLHPVDGGVVVDPPTTSTTSPSSATTSSSPSNTRSSLNTRYDYYDKGPQIVDLQEELGMDSVDGVYGPQTRKAHMAALGSSMSAILHFYPEVMQSPTPCSHGCEPGDGHYELPTLGELINEYFKPEDRALAQRIAFCESSGRSWDIGSTEVSSALAIGWFQHLAKYWMERSEKAGFKGYPPFHGRANVATAAWLYYNSGVHHWNPSKACWEDSVA